MLLVENAPICDVVKAETSSVDKKLSCRVVIAAIWAVVLPRMKFDAAIFRPLFFIYLVTHFDQMRNMRAYKNCQSALTLGLRPFLVNGIFLKNFRVIRKLFLLHNATTKLGDEVIAQTCDVIKENTLANGVNLEDQAQRN